MADTKLRLLGVGVIDVNSLHLVYVIDGQDPDLMVKKNNDGKKNCI